MESNARTALIAGVMALIMDRKPPKKENRQPLINRIMIGALKFIGGIMIAAAIVATCLIRFT